MISPRRRCQYPKIWVEFSFTRSRYEEKNCAYRDDWAVILSDSCQDCIQSLICDLEEDKNMFLENLYTPASFGTLRWLFGQLDLQWVAYICRHIQTDIPRGQWVRDSTRPMSAKSQEISEASVVVMMPPPSPPVAASFKASPTSSLDWPKSFIKGVTPEGY